MNKGLDPKGGRFRGNLASLADTDKWQDAMADSGYIFFEEQSETALVTMFEPLSFNATHVSATPRLRVGSLKTEVVLTARHRY